MPGPRPPWLPWPWARASPCRTRRIRRRSRRRSHHRRRDRSSRRPYRTILPSGSWRHHPRRRWAPYE